MGKHKRIIIVTIITTLLTMVASIYTKYIEVTSENTIETTETTKPSQITKEEPTKNVVNEEIIKVNDNLLSELTDNWLIDEKLSYYKRSWSIDKKKGLYSQNDSSALFFKELSDSQLKNVTISVDLCLNADEFKQSNGGIFFSSKKESDNYDCICIFKNEIEKGIKNNDTNFTKNIENGKYYNLKICFKNNSFDFYLNNQYISSSTKKYNGNRFGLINNYGKTYYKNFKIE